MEEDAAADREAQGSSRGRLVAARWRNAYVLWSALYGVTALTQTASLPEGETPDALIDALVTTYIAGLKAQQA